MVDPRPDRLHAVGIGRWKDGVTDGARFPDQTRSFALGPCDQSNNFAHIGSTGGKRGNWQAGLVKRPNRRRNPPSRVPFVSSAGRTRR
ncbi:hypothetical protein EI171_38365 [Bradyrhizobium sp. LCT2]|nr:hypothetical protein EI171_38365 [Bradyrhizobium sp. LCT2]